MSKDGDWLFRKAVLKAGLLDHATLKKYEKEVYLDDREVPGARLPDILTWQGVLTPEQIGEILRVLNAVLQTCADCGTRRYVAADRKRHTRCKQCRRAMRKQKAASAADEDELPESPDAAEAPPQITVQCPCLVELKNGILL